MHRERQDIAKRRNHRLIAQRHRERQIGLKHLPDQPTFRVPEYRLRQIKLDDLIDEPALASLNRLCEVRFDDDAEGLEFSSRERLSQIGL